MKSRKVCNLFLSCILATVLLCCVPASLRAYDSQAFGEDLDSYFVPAYPTAYSAMVATFSREEVQNLNTVLEAVRIFGYLRTLGNMANKIDGGDYSGATLDAASAVAKVAVRQMVDQTTKKVLICGAGVATLPLTAAIITFDITRASYKAVDDSKTALDLERLYYKVEADPSLKTPGRKLGEGEPIRQDLQTVEHIWRQIYSDKEFEGVFKTYVTTELRQEWPEPTMWEKMTTSSEVLREAKLLEDQKRIKSYIKGLLSELNKVAKKREAAVILAKQLKEIAATGTNFSEDELIKALEYYKYALLKLPQTETYLTAFPNKFDGIKARFDKATPTELTAIKKEIISEQVDIRLFAAAMRGLPTSGQYSATRTTTLTNLKAAYGKLNALYDAIPQSEINKRLEAENKRIIDEAARLDSAGISFELKRYECKKTFDDVKPQFFDKVMKGTGDAEQAVDKTKADVSKFSEEIKDQYNKDYGENDKKYQDGQARIGEQTGRVQQAYNTAKDPNTRDALHAQLEKLKQQSRDLKARFEKYGQIYATTSQIDLTDCGNAITEIDKFYEANKNRFAIVQASLTDQAGLAAALYIKFADVHGTGKFNGTLNFLSAEEIGKLKKMIADAPDGYVGIDLKFLKNHVRMDKDKTLFSGLQDTMKEITGAIKKYMDATGAMRMPYYTSYQTSTLPCLKFMESKDAASAVQDVLKAVDSAMAAYQGVDPRLIPQTSKQEFDNALAMLRVYKKDMESYQKLIGLGSGLSASMEAYLTKAMKQNASVNEDMAYLFSLWQRFNSAQGAMEYQFIMARFNAGRWSFALGTTPPVITGEMAKNAFDRTDILDLSKKLNLGLETLIPDGICEVKAKEGFITIKVEDVHSLAGKIQGLPTTNLTVFYGPMHAMRKSTGAEGFLMEGFFSLGNNLWPMFSFNKAIEGAGQKLRDTIAKQRDAAEKNQSVIDNANARFGLILGKANPAIAAVKQYIAQGQYNSALMYFTVRDDLLTQYGALNAKRADVDAALKELADLIEEAKKKMVAGVAPAPGPMTGPIMGGPMAQGPGGVVQQPGQAQMAQQHAMMQQAQQQGAPAIPQTATPAGLPASVPAPAVQAAAIPIPAMPTAPPPVAAPPAALLSPTSPPVPEPPKSVAKPDTAPVQVTAVPATPVPLQTPAVVPVPAAPSPTPQTLSTQVTPAPVPVITPPKVADVSPPPVPKPAVTQPVPVSPPSDPVKSQAALVVAAAPAASPSTTVAKPVAVPPPAAPKPAATPSPSLRDKEDVAKIKALYHQLARAYESRRSRDVTTCFSPEWQGSDGISMGELRNTLDQMFSVYDEVRCTIQDLNIDKAGDSRYKVTYEVNLNLKATKKNLKQETKSRITEEVTVDRSVRPRITKTLSGAPWRVK